MRKSYFLFHQYSVGLLSIILEITTCEFRFNGGNTQLLLPTERGGVGEKERDPHRDKPCIPKHRLEEYKSVCFCRQLIPQRGGEKE